MENNNNLIKNDLNELVSSFAKLKKREQNNIIVSFALAKDKKFEKENLQHIIASAVFISGKDIEKMNANLKKGVINSYYDFINVPYLNIFRVVNDTIEPFKEIDISKITEFNYTICDYNSFFNTFDYRDFESMIESHNDNVTKNTIFIFENIYWSVLLLLFRKNGIVVSGGSNTKRHILSPIQLRVSNFVTALFGNGYIPVIKSFDYNYKNTKEMKQVIENMASEKIKEWIKQL